MAFDPAQPRLVSHLRPHREPVSLVTIGLVMVVVAVVALGIAFATGVVGLAEPTPAAERGAGLIRSDLALRVQWTLPRRA
ncbi:hypothetical protein [Polymorphobacter sp.]|uniref:hypothetical protein n=1 Tax=Polymorphobacter sp. TaxID=1909290 RepID=UPI003F714786